MQLAVNAGLLVYRCHQNEMQVLLALPDSSFALKKDAGQWTIPHAPLAAQDDLYQGAIDAFRHATGSAPALCHTTPLGWIFDPWDEIFYAWSCPSAYNAAQPPCTARLRGESERHQHLPVFAALTFFSLDTAAQKIQRAQRPFLSRLRQELNKHGSLFCAAIC